MILIGTKCRLEQTVTDALTAANVGSGALPVFGTPYMSALMENAAMTCLQSFLEEGQGSVGTHLDISHDAPTPIGMKVWAEAEITAAVISAMFTVFIKSESPVDGRPFGEMIPAAELIDAQDPTSIELGPGAIIDLNPGEEPVFADPKHPTTGYDAFTNAMIKLIGAALEIPPEVLLKQFTTSYSAARGALNEFWRVCSMQRDWFADDFCQPIYEEWMAEAVARGRIQAPGFFADPAVRKAYTDCAWNGPARTNLNPVQEVTAATKRVEACFSTAQEETAQMTGGDYNRNVRQRAIEVRRKREVDEIANPPQPAAAPAPGQEPPPGKGKEGQGGEGNA